MALLALLVGSVTVALVSWLAGRDIAGLESLVMTLTAALGVGEASNVGKRATVKPELVAAPPAVEDTL